MQLKTVQIVVMKTCLKIGKSCFGSLCIRDLVNIDTIKKNDAIKEGIIAIVVLCMELGVITWTEMSL